MFEYEQNIVETLMSQSQDFRRMYKKHDELKQRVRDANTRQEPVDDMKLETMKKEKLLLKDKMANMIEHYRMTHAA